jgi:hypothetical protein
MAEQAHKLEVEDTPTPALDAPTYATAGTPSDGEAATSTPSDGGTSEHSGKIPEEELEEETCGFCKFMKAGPCGTVFKVKGFLTFPAYFYVYVSKYCSVSGNPG